jgi:polyferredoxin
MGNIENSYTLKVLNKSQDNKAFRLSVGGIEGADLIGTERVALGAGERREIPVSVSVPPEAVHSSVRDIRFQLRPVDGGDERIIETSRFTGLPD